LITSPLCAFQLAGSLLHPLLSTPAEASFLPFPKQALLCLLAYAFIYAWNDINPPSHFFYQANSQLVFSLDVQSFEKPFLTLQSG
jgi:hypothetical protein